MEALTPENRAPAPGGLGLLQEFLNSGHLGAAGRIAPGLAETIRARNAAGDSQGLLASEYGFNQGFVNAILRHAPLADELETAPSAQAWLAARGLLRPGGQIREAELTLLWELRDLLREMAAANNGHDLGPGVADSFDRIASRAPLFVTFKGRAKPSLGPEGEGIQAAIGRLLTLLFAAMSDGMWQRLKRCPGNGCPFTFYDASRNRTGTWCAMSVCGNRAKVRSYQRRQRVSPAI